MSVSDVVQSHLEVLMEELLQTDELVVDDDGDIGVRDAAIGGWWARVRRGSTPHIEVFTYAVRGVESDPGLLEALNAVNRRLSHCRVFHVDDVVVVAGELLGETATVEDLACLSAEVAQTSRDHGPGLAAAFGGASAGDQPEEGR